MRYTYGVRLHYAALYIDIYLYDKEKAYIMPKISELTELLEASITGTENIPIVDTTDTTKRVTVNNYLSSVASFIDIDTAIADSIQVISQDLSQGTSVNLNYPNKAIITIYNLTNPDTSGNSVVTIDEDTRFFLIFNNDASYSIQATGDTSINIYNGTNSTNPVTISANSAMFGINQKAMATFTYVFFFDSY